MRRMLWCVMSKHRKQGILTPRPQPLPGQAPYPTQAQYALAPPPVPIPFGHAPLAPAFEVRVQVLDDEHATVAHAELISLANGYQPVAKVSGSSKRDSADSYDPDTGTALAVGRALARLGRLLVKQAQGNVTHADSVRMHRAERAAHQAVRELRDEAAEARLAASPARHVVDAFLDDPSTGVRRTRPGKHERKDRA